MRFTPLCSSAPKLPTSRVSATSAASSVSSSGSASGQASANTRTSAPNAAAFTTTLMNAVTGVGAPVYTSGAHWWNGANETLKPSPANTRTPPSSASGAVGPSPSAAAMSVNANAPVAPYTSATP